MENKVSKINEAVLFVHNRILNHCKRKSSFSITKNQWSENNNNIYSRFGYKEKKKGQKQDAKVSNIIHHQLMTKKSDVLVHLIVSFCIEFQLDVVAYVKKGNNQSYKTSIFCHDIDQCQWNDKLLIQDHNEFPLQLHFKVVLQSRLKGRLRLYQLERILNAKKFDHDIAMAWQWVKNTHILQTTIQSF